MKRRPYKDSLAYLKQKKELERAAKKSEGFWNKSASLYLDPSYWPSLLAIFFAFSFFALRHGNQEICRDQEDCEERRKVFKAIRRIKTRPNILPKSCN